VFHLEGYWVWDFWFAHDGERHHLFYLHAPKSIGDPDQRHWNVSIGHASSPDLVAWTNHGRSFGPSDGDAWDNFTTWTGSVIRHDGLWYLFYTGTNRGERGLKQRIGIATSKNLQEWTRVCDRPALDLDPRWYEEYEPGVWQDRAWRDPWVFANPDGRGFSMVYTARAKDGDTATRGVIGYATSTDLLHWEARPPVYRSHEFGHLEVPQVAQIDGRWVCLFCTEAKYFGAEYAKTAVGGPLTGTHYLIGEGPLGPWRLAPGPFFDGDKRGSRYAGRAVRHNGCWYYFAFRHTAEDGSFIGDIDGPYRLGFSKAGQLTIGERLTAHEQQPAPLLRPVRETATAEVAKPAGAPADNR
jgi:beta-fructofuranosidase